MVSLPIQHCCLGHPVSSILKFLQSCHFISSNQNKIPIFHACPLEKHCRLPFPTSMCKTTSMLELIHFDLWISYVTSWCDFKYYTLFLDDFCIFYWFFLFVLNLRCLLCSAILECMLKINLELTFNRSNVTMGTDLITILLT